jgi:hypothetical protein
MPLITFLILAYFFPDTAGSRPVKEDCPDITVTYTIEKVTDQTSKIVVKAQGGKAPYHYFFLNKKGGVLTWKTENNSYEASAKSMPASFTVVDNEGCTKKIVLKESVN